MNKVALFIAGDENIFFPAIVAMESIKKNNPGVFDYFICFDGSKLDSNMSAIIDASKINFVDSKVLSGYVNLDDFKSMSEGIWPVEVFLNYAMPVYLKKIGYKYSCKADYDILCVSKYDIEEIIPGENALSGWCGAVNLGLQNVPEAVIADLVSDAIIRSRHVDYMNVGFILFNNEYYVDNKLLDRFSKFYHYLCNKCPDAMLLEQIAFSLLLSSLNGQFTKISESYNHRVLSSKDTDSDLMFDVKNIHYITRCKPWKPLVINTIKWFVGNHGGCLFSYRNAWLEFAETVDGFERYCSERKLNTMQLIGLQMVVSREYNRIISQIKK